jgi:tetratricopeptide (TPR) repeat protein
MLERLLPGANLPEELRRDVLTHAAGIPLYLETIARLLINEGIATSAEASADWAERVRTVLSDPLRLYGQTVIDQLSEPQCDLLGQCAVQGQSFDPDVIEVLWRLSDHPRLPVRVRLAELERQGLVQHTGHAWWTQWSFTHPLVHQACYQALAPLDRQRLHRRTAEALNEIGDRLGRPLPELLAYHYECAEHWALAARANLHAGNRAGDIFLNDEALRRYQRVIEMIGQLETPSEDLMLVKVRALQGAAKVGLRVGAYNQVAVHAEAMRALATQPEDQAQADRLTALVSFNRGQTDAAERLLLNSLERARHADHTQHVMAEILCDLVELYRVAGGYQVARERLHECGALAFSSDDHTLIRTKLLEADLADAEGQRAAVSALYAQAHALAQQAGSLTDLARASNGLGCAALDLGDYEAAQHHFERALEICELTGDTEWIGCAHGNLGLVAMSQGNFDIAQDHYERTLAVYQMTGPAYRSATVQANLAICALEEEDVLGAVTAADTALAMSRRSGHAGLQAQIQAWLGAGRLECGDVQGAEEVFKAILHDYDEEHQPVAIALACRGLGRVALMQGRPDTALDWLERAQAGFERLAWAQETARTALYQALALRHRGEVQAARIALERAREQFISKRMQANRDAERTEQLLRELDAALSI